VEGSPLACFQNNMNSIFDNLYTEAIDLLHGLTTSHGIQASTVEADNYKRIWARDSIVCGLAGLIVKDTIVIEGLGNSLLTLAGNQHELGMIPSNVSPDGAGVSFGSLVGRVDSNTWFIIGCCLYYQRTGNEKTWKQLLPAIRKCRTYLKSIEFNNKGWLYTPLSGNWADEYPVHGYTLYDNCLRLCGETLYLEIMGGDSKDLETLKKRLFANFWPLEETPSKLQYHKTAFQELDKKQIMHFLSFIVPGNYDTRFDAAANALALLQFDLNNLQKEKISQFVRGLSKELSQPLIPAFWPIINKQSEDWHLLKGNYSFSFKNTSGDFHNGGIWPVWMGLFCLGLARNGLSKEAKEIITAFTQIVDKNPDWNFQEYFNALTLNVGGKTQMGYTAAGIVFMKLALDKE